MNNPSEALQTVATSPWYPPLSTALLVTMLVALLLRAIVVSHSRFEWCAISAALLFLGVVGLREQWVQEGFEALGVNLACVRLMAHGCAVLGGAMLFSLGVAWAHGYRLSRPSWWRAMAFMHLPAVACIAIMAVVSMPALQQNRAIEEFPSRIGLYGVVYATVPIIGAIYVGVTAARAGFSRDVAHQLNVPVGIIATVVAGLSVLDHAFRVVTAFQTSHTPPEELQTALHDRAASTDWLLMLPVGIALLSLMPAVFISLARRVAASPDEARLRELRELWLALVSAFPQIRLNRAAALSSPAEELHRTLVEVEDALLLATKWMTDEELDAETVEERFSAVSAAVDRSDEEPPLRAAVVMPWTRDEEAIYDLARRSDMTWESYYAP